MSSDPRQRVTSPQFWQVRDAITEYLDSRLVPLTDLADRFAGLVGSGDRATGPFAESQLEALVPELEAVLASYPDFLGSGFVAAPRVVADRERYLLWLQRQATGFRRLRLNLNPGDPDLYDYFEMEWFSRARASLVPTVYGPYIDYAGSDHLVLTAAVPLQSGREFLGVIGGDLLVDSVEQRLVQHLSDAPAGAVVVNADRSVIACNSAHWLPGERLGRHPADDRASYHAVGALGDWTGWVLAVPAD